MKRALVVRVVMALACAGCGEGGSQPAPPTPTPPKPDYRASEARNYIDYFASNDTQQWELAKQRLVALGPAIAPVLFAAMQERPGEVEFTLRWLLHHVITHEAYHGGQAVLLSIMKQKLGA